MSYNRFEPGSIENPLPCEEVEGQTYTRFQPISATNPYPVMVVDEDAYTSFENVSEANPLPIAMGDGSYTIFEPLSEANRLPVVLVEGQSYDPKQPVSMTNPYPVIDTTAEEEPSYTGPLDLVPGAVFGYSQRALDAAHIGQTVITLQRDSDDESLGFVASASGGIDTAAVLTWLDEAGGFLTLLADQSSNGYTGESGGTAGGMAWQADAGGGLPALLSEGESFSNSSVDVAAGARTFALVINYTQNSGGDKFFALSVGGVVLEFGSNFDNPNELYVHFTNGVDAEYYANTVATLSTGRHLLELLFAANGTLTLFIDGVDTSLTVDTAYVTLPQMTNALLSVPDLANEQQKTLEFVCWPASTSAARANIKTYYGIL